MVKEMTLKIPVGFTVGSILSCYYGYGVELYPKASRERLECLVGPELLVDSECLIASVVSKLDGLCPDWSIHSLNSVGEWVRLRMKCYFPELDHLSLETLEWIFTWSNR